MDSFEKHSEKQRCSSVNRSFGARKHAHRPPRNKPARKHANQQITNTDENNKCKKQNKKSSNPVTKITNTVAVISPIGGVLSFNQLIESSKSKFVCRFLFIVITNRL
jgi:hypothetical protein